MTKEECKNRVYTAVHKLNLLDHKLKFSFVEGVHGWLLKAENSHGDRFGTYEIMVVFTDYKRKIDAYTSFVKQVELMFAGTRLTAPNAYHNMY